ncbi:MAG: hypothetical protein LBI04_11100 [Treponema sp.]|jgi:hypothetical protein|nr:hypothetical protein [Treponema sp.]
MKKIKITMMLIAAILFSCLFIMGCSDNTEDPPIKVQGNVLILQAYGNAGDGSPAGVSHSFVELYNISNKAIKLDGISLYYADGISGADEDVTADEPWKKIALTGTIPAKGSFLVLGAKHSVLSSTRHIIDDNYGDINDENLALSRRGFKVAIIKSTEELTVQNPFSNDGAGKPVTGYIDMVGALNDSGANPPDHIFGFETEPAGNSASKAVRRSTLTDTDDNSEDFESIRYSSDGITDEELAVYAPRNSKAGSWNPFAEVKEPENPTVVGPISEYAGKLLIWQVGAAKDGAITRSFVELYNNTDSPINMDTYSLQYANTAGVTWIKINLTGTIPAHSSYLVRGQLGTITDTSRLYIEEADKTIDNFVLSNDYFKVALMANQYKLTVENPFNMTGGKAADYVDMIGAYNADADANVMDAYEAARFSPISKQAAARRGSLTDTDDNSADFERIDYRISGISDTNLVKFKPKTANYGEWNPVTGVKKNKPPTSVTITETGVSSGKLELMQEASVTLSANFAPADADTTGVTYSWAVSPASVLTCGLTTESTFEITAAGAGTATVTLTVSGGAISVSISDSIQVTVSTGTPMLMILQVFGMHAENDSAPTHSFIELYNNTNTAINLSTYSVHWANGLSSNSNAPAEKDVWNKINLSGNIPAKGSYLILGAQMVDAATIANASTNGRLDLTTVTADVNESTFKMSNRSYKVALMSNQSDISVANPWGEAACVDLVSAINTSGTDSVTAAKGTDDLAAVNASSGGANTISKQKSYRRTSLTVTGDTLTDFTSKQYSSISEADIAKFRPRTAAGTIDGYIPEF